MARVVIPGLKHHVASRGGRRHRTPFHENDYQCYIELLAAHAGERGTEVQACCLMPDYVHLVMVPGKQGGLRAALGEAHRYYTRRVNFREGWVLSGKSLAPRRRGRKPAGD